MDPIHSIAAASLARKDDANPTSTEIDAFYEEHGSELFIAISHAPRRILRNIGKMRWISIRDLRFAKWAVSR